MQIQPRSWLDLHRLDARCNCNAFALHIYCNRNANTYAFASDCGGCG